VAKILEYTTDLKCANGPFLAVDNMPFLFLRGRSGHHYEEALEAVAKSGSLMQQLRVPRSDEVWAEMEDLNSAIREAMGVRAAEAGASGQKA